jgi:hypothetical protein
LRIYSNVKAQKGLQILFVFITAIVSPFSFAQKPALSTKTSSEINHSNSVLSLPWSTLKRSSVFGQFRFETMQYATAQKSSPSLSSTQFLSGRITAASYKSEPYSFNWAADLSAGTFFSLRQSYYSVQEIYGSVPLSNSMSVSFGRKKYDWTEVDKVWSLGLWQPRYAIDALRPEDQGLTGIFLDYKTDLFQIVAFGSGIFIPTMGPDIREEDGSIKADNRWYRPPSNKAGKINISYKIEADSTKLVKQESYGVKFRLGEQTQGPWISAAVGEKPVNDLILQRCLHCVAVTSEANFVVNPEVAHHKIYSADMGYQSENSNASVSYVEDHPKTILPEEDHAIQQLSPIKIYSAQVEWRIKDFLERPLQVQFAYMKSYGDKIEDIESNGEVSDLTIFTYRYRFSNAALAKVMGPLMSLYGRSLITKLAYTYDFDQKGAIFGLEFQYQWNRKWSYLLGADILGSDDSKSTSDGFINTYRANDRAYAGVSYVF